MASSQVIGKPVGGGRPQYPDGILMPDPNNPGGWITPAPPHDSGSGSSGGSAGSSGSAGSTPFRSYTTGERQTGTDNIVVKKTATDNGQGQFLTSQGGTINYNTGVWRFKPTDPYRYSEYQSSRTTSGGQDTGTWTSATSEDTWGDGSLIRVYYRPDSVAPQLHSEQLPPQKITINLTPTTGDSVVPGVVAFTIGATQYIDRDGKIYRNVQAGGSGTLSGSIDYQSGIVTLDSWDAGSSAFTLLSLLTYRGQWDETEFYFYTDAAPIQSASLQISVVTVDGDNLVGRADADGKITGDRIDGTIDVQTGFAHIRFGALVLAADLTDEEKAESWYNPADIDASGDIWKPVKIIPPTARYNTVVLSFLPVDTDILGVDPVRLPTDGRVPIFRAGDVAYLLHDDTLEATPVFNDALTRYEIDLGRQRIAWVKLWDRDGKLVPNGYELDRAAGLVWFPNITGLQSPLTVRHTIADLLRINDAQITGKLSFLLPVTHDFPAGSVMASCLLHGDRHARVSLTFDQYSWNKKTWTDSVDGDEAIAELDLIAHPIEVTNKGAITERWAVWWKSSSGEVEVYGEHRGLVYSGTYDNQTDIMPVNPATITADDPDGVPFFKVLGAANRGGWLNGNLFRFNTEGASIPVWIARSIQPSQMPAGDGLDGCEIYCQGNKRRKED